MLGLAQGTANAPHAKAPWRRARPNKESSFLADNLFLIMFGVFCLLLYLRSLGLS